MMKPPPVRCVILALAMAIGFSLGAAAQPVLTDDAHTGNGPNANSGSNPNLSLSGNGPVYLKFDLISGFASSTPGAAIDKATLQLYAGSVTTAGSLEIYAVADAWNEKTITASNAPPLGMLVSIAEISTGNRNRFVTLDLTALVQQWLGDDGLGTNGMPNHGIALVARGDTNVTFDSKENSQTSHEPQLHVQLHAGIEGPSGVASVNADAPLSVTNATTTPTISLGLVPMAYGGTGLSAAGADRNFLRSAAGAWVSAPLTASDMPDLAGSYIRNASAPQAAAHFNIAGTGTADVLNATTQFNLGASRILSNAGTNNLFAGVNAGANNTTGAANAFFGRNAGQANTSGLSNSFVGYNAGAGNITGQRNSFLGDAAGFVNAGGNDNSFFGFLAGFHNTAGGNAYFGSLAGADTTTGSGNSFYGFNAGVHNTTGFANAFFGLNAGSSTTTTFGNSYFGSFAGVNSTGSLNSFFGGDAGFNTSSGGENVFVGHAAGYGNKTGWDNSFVGRSSGLSNVSGSNNTLIGVLADVSAPDLNFATAIGAGAKVSTSNTIVLGRSADAVQVPGAFTVAGSFGANILSASSQFNIRGNRVLAVSGTAADPDTNVFAGVGAGAHNPSGVGNSFFGANAGSNTVAGNRNSFFGTAAGYGNTTGDGNAFFGQLAGFTNTAGESNSFFGQGAGLSNTTGSSNAFIGNSAGGFNGTGRFNTFVGSAASGHNTSGNNNTVVGAFADLGANSLISATAIGAFARVDTSDTIILGKAAGNYFGVVRPADTVQIPGTLKVSGALSVDSHYDIAGAKILTVSGPHSEVSFDLPASNLFVGQAAGANTTPDTAPDSYAGRLNTFVGASAGQANTSGGINSFIGTRAGASNTTGFSNVMFGVFAGEFNTTGSENVFVGNLAGRFNTEGRLNTFVGPSAGAGNSTGGANVFVGIGAGLGNTTGQGNSFFGPSSGANNTDGERNTYIGNGAGGQTFSARDSTMLGTGANGVGYSLEFAAAIGARARVGASDTIVIGKAADTYDGVARPADAVHMPGSLRVGGKIYVETAGQGVILKSPGGTCYQLTVSDSGGLSTVASSCP